MPFGTVWDHFGPFWTILAILDQVGQYGENGPKWSKIAQNGPKWFQTVPNGPKRSKTVPSNHYWSKMVSM